MRHRPRPALLIIVFTVLALLFFLDLQGNYFLGEFKARALALIKDKIGLDGEIGAVEGGIFRGVILRDVRLFGRDPSQAKQLFFSAAAIDLDYRLWDIAFGRQGKPSKITLLSPKVYFFEGEKKPQAVPKAFEPSWKEMTVSIRDGSFLNAQKVPVISEFNGNFRLDEKGIESNSVTASVIGQRFSGKGKVGFPIERSAVRMEGSIKGDGYMLRARLDGALDRIYVHGSFDILNRLNLNFAGNIAASEGAVSFNDFRFGPKLIMNGLLQTAEKGFSFDLYPEDMSGNNAAMGEVSRLSVTGDFTKLPYFNLGLNASHLKILGVDLLSNYAITGKLVYGADNKVKAVAGEFSTSGSVVNYDPVREIKGAYELKDGIMKLTGVNYGDVVYATGSIGTGLKSSIDLHIKFKGAQLGGLTDLAMEKGAVSGLVFGDINVSGGLGRETAIEGQMEFMKGNIGVVEYDSAKIGLKGKGSILEFVDSKVYTGNQVLTVEGKIDLRDIGTPRVFRSVVIKADPKTVIWAGANITGRQPAEPQGNADESGQFKINLRTYESQQGNQLPRQDGQGIEYKLSKPNNVKLEMKENDEFFGVEHKVRF